MKKIHLMFFIGSLLISCGTTGTLMLDTLSDTDIQRLEEAETFLIQFRFERDPQYLSAADDVLQELENKDTANKEFSARRACLRAEWILLSTGDEGSEMAEELLSQAAHWNPVEERLAILQSMLTVDREKKLIILEEASQSPNAARIFLELGEAYFNLNRFTEAVSAFDTAFIKVSTVISHYYRPKRDLAYSIQNLNFRSLHSASYLKGGPVSVDTAIALLYLETGMLKNMISSLEAGTYFETLKRGGYFSSENLGADDFAKRKELAFLLAQIIASNQRNPRLLKETRDYYLQNGWSSPIPDLSVQSPYFAPVVLMVEQEIMVLPDGRHFYPEELISTEEYLGILKKLQSLYP